MQLRRPRSRSAHHLPRHDSQVRRRCVKGLGVFTVFVLHLRFLFVSLLRIANLLHPLSLSKHQQIPRQRAESALRRSPTPDQDGQCCFPEPSRQCKGWRRMLDGCGLCERGGGKNLFRDEELEGCVNWCVRTCERNETTVESFVYPQVRGEPHRIALNELACTFLVLPRRVSSAAPQAASTSSSSLSPSSGSNDDDAAVRVSSSMNRGLTV